MSLNPKQSVSTLSDQLSDRPYSRHLPLIVTFGLFVVAALTGGAADDNELLPTVRFLSLVMLALGMYAAYVTETRCAYGGKLWACALVSAGCTGLGAGFLWTGAAFGAGFLFLMLGGLVGSLLIANQLQEKVRRRRLAIQERTKNPDMVSN